MLKKQKNQEGEVETVLKTLREALGLTQQELADLLGVHRITIVRCETGQREITFTIGQFQRFCSLINKHLGAVALLHFVTGEPMEFSSFNTASVKNCINLGKKST
jgi:DNA-binding XRE family transcriptional regulator